MSRPTAGPSAKPPVDGVPRDGPRCVIVDDNDRFVDLVTELLVREGFEVVGRADQSGEAMRVIGETRPDLALIDLYLGDENGIELVAEIVRLGLATRTCLLLISTCAASDLHELCELSLAHGYLAKTDLCGRALRELLLDWTESPRDTGGGEH